MPPVDWDEYAKTYRQIESGSAVPALLAHHLSGRSGSLIDIGCGEGHLLDELANRFPSWELTGFEISPFRAEIAASRGHRVLVDRDGRMPDGHYDVVVSAHVIEHVHDHVEHAKDLSALLQPEGIVYVETPLKLRGAWYFRRSPTAGWVLDPTHVREYRSVEELVEVLEAAGLKVVARHVTPLRFPLGAGVALVRRLLRLDRGRGASSGRLSSLCVPIPRYRIMGVLATKA